MTAYQVRVDMAVVADTPDDALALVSLALESNAELLPLVCGLACEGEIVG